MKECSEEGCTYPVFSGGLCRMHKKIKSKSSISRSPIKRKPKIKTHQTDFNADETKLKSYSTSQLKRVADYWLRQYLLKRAVRNDRGQIKCFITGKWYNESDLHVCHYIDRQYNYCRFSELNCHLINKWSNTIDNRVYDEDKYGKNISRHIYEYSKKLIDTYGESILEHLELCKNSKLTFNKNILIDVIKHFSEKGEAKIKFYFKDHIFLKNPRYREKPFIICDEIPFRQSDVLYIYYPSGYGECMATYSNLLSTSHPNIRNAKNKNRYFLNELKEKNIAYKENRFKVLTEYKNVNQTLILEDKWGKHKMTVSSIKHKGNKPDISTAIDKIVYLNNMLADYRDDVSELNIVKYINSTDVRLNSRYGECKTTVGNLKNGYKPSIISAVNRTEYFLNRCKHINKKLDWRGIKLLNEYKDKDTVVYFQDEKSVYSISARGFSSSTTFSMKNSIVKKEYFLNFYAKSKLNYSKVDFNKKESEKQIIICNKHGEFKQTLDSHKNCKYCCPSCSRMTSYKKDSWVKLNKGRKVMFYIIECTGQNEKFYKIGITHNLKKRYENNKQLPYNYRVIYSYESFDAAFIWDMEKYVINNMDKKYEFEPSIFFKGSVTEVFKEEGLNSINKLINNFLINRQHGKKS